MPNRLRARIFSVWSLPVLGIAAAKVLFHLSIAGRYGIFRDELYYLACSEHLDWGYVDQPPMIALLVWIAKHTFGDSLLGLRLLPALAGGTLVLVTSRLTAEMGGRSFARALAALAVAIVPIYLIMHHWMTMNAFEPLIWMGSAWCIMRALSYGRARYWIAFGVLIGIGMETKYSAVFFVAAVVVGLVLTPHRRVLRNRWFWIAGVIALVVFLPNFIWLAQHDFPFLELMSNIRRTGRDVVRGPVAFVLDQTMLLNPITAPLWVTGLLWLLFAKGGRQYQVFGWTYCLLLALFVALRGKNYYLAPAYPMLFAAGGVAFEAVFRERLHWLRFIYVGALVIAGFTLAPLASPVLPPDTYIRYQSFLGIQPSRAENQATGPLPQHFADEFGWEDMTREVARIYGKLPPEERARTAIFANNYGEAGAIDFFGAKYGLPKAISNHQNYWLWGPREYTGDVVIVLGSDGRGDRQVFQDVEVAGRVQHEYSRRDESFDVFLCRRLKTDLATLWAQIKKWD